MNASNATLPRRARLVFAAAALATLAGCAGFDGARLVPGTARLEDVERDMGKPALRWQNPDGSQQLAYPRGPTGYETFMVQIGPDGRLVSITNALDTAGFAAVRAGMSQDEVLRVLGPSNPALTVYFEARDELVWDWRYCTNWNEPARFYVLFEGKTGKVRSTMSMTESLLGWYRDSRPICGRWFPPRHGG